MIPLCLSFGDRAMERNGTETQMVTIKEMVLLSQWNIQSS